MPNFTALRAACAASSALSRLVIDEFLLYYAAERDGLAREFDQRLTRFRTVTKELPANWPGLIKAQYIAHRIFKKSGLVKKYLTHAAVKALPAEQQRWLERQTTVPWRFSYSVITKSPATDFYDMEDVFNGETYLLHSPSTSKILSEASVALWFNLIGFNGSCWQSYGPVVPFKGFEPDDIFFFATELDPRVETEEDLLADVEQNPVPYLTLVTNSQIPFIVIGDDQMVQLAAEHDLPVLDTATLRKTFQIEYAQGIYRIRFGGWGEPPHYAAAYYAEDRKTLLLTALTDRGFRALIAELNKHGLGLPIEADIRVQISMLSAIKQILGKSIRLDPYEALFTVESTQKDKDTMDKLNRLLALALPFINANQDPDIPALAKEAGVDEETARELLGHSIDRIKTLKAKGGKA